MSLARTSSLWLTRHMSKHVAKNCCGKVIRKGYFRRRGTKHPIQRFQCKQCRKFFSTATRDRAYRQHKRHLNRRLFHLLSSAVTQRRCAKILGCTRTTVARKFRRLAALSVERQAKLLARLPRFEEIQFDELETFEHTKCKPLSVPLAVTKQERIILAYAVASMPAKGKLAKISRSKYGKRADDRHKHIGAVLSQAAQFALPGAIIKSDQCPRYPAPVKKHLPEAVHVTVKGRRGCIVGQGELKKIGKDPLFALNHTCAMARANISRLVRRTWATTKKASALLDHLAIYVWYHNSKLIKIDY